MKYFLLVIGLLVAVAAALVLVPVKDGQPLVSFESVEKQLSEVGLPRFGEEQETLPTLYRWRDAQGQWQFGQVPPPGVVAEPVEQKNIRTLSPEQFRQGGQPGKNP
ncbi:MAG: DUF4124 domain-containing protein [Alcanivoracaceae bacterium]|jgi:hypothetical protein